MSLAVDKGVDVRLARAGRFYLPELDVLRFFAFLLVFVFHVPLGGAIWYSKQGFFGSLGDAGAFGVDLFFTLSGYLISSLLLRERQETGDIDLKEFYARRTLRIWPLYYFSLALAFMITQIPASIVSAPPWLGDVFPPMHPNTYLFMAIFLFNFNFAGSLFYAPVPFMAHLWSISVEEQFYLLWPWFVRYVSRRRIAIIPIAMIAVAVAARAVILRLNPNALPWNNTFTRIDPIAVGILIALMPRLNPRPALRLVLVGVGLASWIFAAYYCGIPFERSTESISLGYPAIAIGSGAFVLATLGTKVFNPSSVLIRLMIYLGKISYGLYVYNIIAIASAKLLHFRGVLEVILPESWRPWWAVTSIYIVTAFGLNVALAAVSYRWLETPFLRLKERFTRVPSRAV
jgi:peptidoglycan/LPS O-acetylase OafA/YrhL